MRPFGLPEHYPVWFKCGICRVEITSPDGPQPFGMVILNNNQNDTVCTPCFRRMSELPNAAKSDAAWTCCLCGRFAPTESRGLVGFGWQNLQPACHPCLRRVFAIPPRETAPS